jgi:glycosyltransferase involved in cell wall biosynthesis
LNAPAKYTIILPVRNGGHYIRECISSILAQTFVNFNLIVLIHDSNDGTLQWLNLVNDERVEVYNAENIDGINGNWSRIKDLQKNEFMTIIGYDDILYPQYLEGIDRLISQYPDASLYQAHFQYIDSVGAPIRKCNPMKERMSPADVLSGILRGTLDICGSGFMMRSKDYDTIGGIPMYPNLLFADFQLWIDLTRKNFMAVSPKELFAFRIHKSTTTISSDLKMGLAFEKFITYLEDIKRNDPALGKVITENANALLDFYCQGLTSRVLRTPVSKRNGKKVRDIVQEFKSYADRLSPSQPFRPLNNKIVRSAMFIDSNRLTRNLFLLFKKVYSQPVAGKR